MRPCQYIFINKGLGMTTGKAAAQAAHAAVEGYRLSLGLDAHQPQEDREARENAVARNWYKGGHYMKLTMELPDSLSMFAVRDYLEARGFRTALIVDEGHTEGTYFVPTALGVEIVDKDHTNVQETFSGFKLYKDREPAPWVPHSSALTRWGRRREIGRALARNYRERGLLE